MDHIQSKYSIDLGYLTSSNSHSGSSSSSSSASSAHHKQNKFFKRNTKNLNPLLANLTKSSDNKTNINNNNNKCLTQTTQNALNNNLTTTSTTNNKNNVISAAASSIQAELNSNYMAYSELNRRYKPPDIAPPPLANAASSSVQSSTAVIKSVAKEKNKNIHVFITGLNTFPVYCHVVSYFAI